MSIDLTVPDLGGFSEIPVIEVLVQPGERVEKETPLVMLESDKATMEVPASAAGVVKDIRVKVGDKVSQGSVLVTVDSGEAASAASAPAASSTTTERGAAAIASKDDLVGAATADAGATEESKNNDAGGGAPRQAQDDTTAGTPRANGTVNRASAQASTAPAPSGAPMHASPAIRRFARELGADLGAIAGSGPNGRITRDDVQAFVKRAISAAPTTGGIGLNLPPWPSVDFAKFGPVERVALSRIQKISGPILARNWVMIPHVTQNEDADVTELEAFRKQINSERKDVKVTMLAFLIKAAVAALQRFPQFNSSLDGDELVLKKYYNIGFAADTPNGLVVPVIKDADRKGILEIARETAELGAKARDGKLMPADMSGATFTISSLGSIGGTTFTPIINAPEVAILGACKAEIRPVWDGSAFAPRLVQPLSLSYDHRVIDGANAARFCVALKESLADLRRVLL